MTATMEAPAPTSTEAGSAENKNVKTQLAESGLDYFSAGMLAEHIDDLDQIMSDEGTRSEKITELEHLISDIALQIEGKVYDEGTGNEQGIHDALTDEQRALVQAAVIEKIGEEGLDWLNDHVNELNFTPEEKATIQALFSRDATEALKNNSPEAVTNENIVDELLEASQNAEGHETITTVEAVIIAGDLNKLSEATTAEEYDQALAVLHSSLENAVMSEISEDLRAKIDEMAENARGEFDNSSAEDGENPAQEHARVLVEASANEEGEPTLSEAGARMIAEKLEELNGEDDLDALVQIVHDLATTVRFIEQYEGQAIADEARSATMRMLEELLGPDKARELNDRINEDMDSIDPARGAEREQLERERQSIDQILTLAARARDAKAGGDENGADSMQQGVAALLMIYSNDYGWDDAKRLEIIEQIQAIAQGNAEPISAGPEGAAVPAGAETTDDDTEAEATTERGFRNRLAALKGALSSAARGDIAGAVEGTRYALGRNAEGNPERQGWSRKKKLLVLAAGAAAIYGLHRYGVIDANPFDGDGIDLNPFNNEGSGSRGGSGGDAVPAVEAPVEPAGYSEVVNSGDTTGATYVMGKMFGGKLSPEQLHDVYLTAVQEKGSQGFADLMTGNVVALPNPVDKWGTVTQINPGDVGFTGGGRQYLEQVARAKGYLG